MAGYKDTAGNERFIEIDLPAVERVYDRLNVDLYDIGSVGRAASSVREFLPVIHCISSHDEPYAEWWKLHRGEAADNAIEATLEALELFYPPHLSRIIRTMRIQTGGAIDAAMKAVEQELEQTFSSLPGRWEYPSLKESRFGNLSGWLKGVFRKLTSSRSR
ncbi:hypothetical protein [Thalassoglobus polymorphus]|uniref:Uncharacterized protein n=1 Tax=Thalassoglobus polymorphus TaxID=2527994 RepID=A0A517QH20_9PLAN|nr:hypothetical protein [Thalassoglobus polymorphus]QDT30936.1 hypothetical protein Mal48_01650 [Thalassoglobus polymorphus]QDT30981.1 hypothetical protein Mal48_02100 [Thalassoglobus polymorphus]